MGHSYVSFRDRTEHAHDSVWIVAARSVAWFAGHHPAWQLPELEAVLSLLRSDEPFIVNGAIQLDLDAVLPDDRAVASFLRLAQATRAELVARGDIMTGADLDAIVNVPGDGEYFDRPMSKQLADLDRLIALVAGPG